MTKKFSLLLITFLFTIILYQPVSADNSSNNLLDVNISTAKNSYSEDEPICLLINIKNNNDYQVTNIKVNSLIPNEFSIVNSKQNSDSLTLAAHEETNIEVYVMKNKQEKETNKSDDEVSKSNKKKSNKKDSTTNESIDSASTNTKFTYILPLIIVLFAIIYAIISHINKKKHRIN